MCNERESRDTFHQTFKQNANGENKVTQNCNSWGLCDHFLV